MIRIHALVVGPDSVIGQELSSWRGRVAEDLHGLVRQLVERVMQSCVHVRRRLSLVGLWTRRSVGRARRRRGGEVGSGSDSIVELVHGRLGVPSAPGR